MGILDRLFGGRSGTTDGSGDVEGAVSTLVGMYQDPEVKADGGISITGRHAMSRPNPTSSGWRARRASSVERMSPSATSCRDAFGTSTPIALRPGMGARMRTSVAAIA